MSRSLTAVLIGAALICGPITHLANAHGVEHNPSRYQHVMQHGVPPSYKALLNPLRMTTENLKSGQALYNEHCAACHGPTGQGDGEGAADLDPKPPALTDMYDRAMQGMGHGGRTGHLMHGVMHHHPGMTHEQAMGGLNLDAYTFWSISEGGEPMGGSMPAFKDVLTETERWQILLYVANGFSAQATQ